jgi:hypothetical protein
MFRFQPISVRMSGTIDSSQRWYGELGTVELVEPRSAVVDEGEPILLRLDLLVRCTPAMSGSSVARHVR